MNTPHLLTLGEAAKLTGMSKTTISNAVKKGKISGGNRGEAGQYQIDPSELFRVYPMKNEGGQPDSEVTVNIERDKTPRIDPALQAIIEAHKALIEEKDKRLSDYEKRLEKTEYQLEDKRTEAAKLKARQPKITRRKMTLWERIKGGEVVEVEEVA